MPQSLFNAHVSSPLQQSSPLAQWTSLFLASTYAKILSLDPSLDAAALGLQLHDPLTIWYCLSAHDPLWLFTAGDDIRVETAGQWTRGCCIVDRRGRVVKDGTGSLDEHVVGDAGGWRDKRRGNRVMRCVQSPGVDKFAGLLLERVFGGA